MSKTQRVFALATAILFLATSVVFSIAVIFLARDEQDPAPSPAAQITNNNNQDNQGETGMLQGTKLQNFKPVADVATLQKIDLQDGSGEVVPKGATVVAHYTGAFAKDGTIFQSSHDFGQPVPFSLSGVIAGWTDGVPGMRVGGKRRLLIPYQQAYGDTGTEDGSIPPKTDLVFDIEVIEIR